MTTAGNHYRRYGFPCCVKQTYDEAITLIYFWTHYGSLSARGAGVSRIHTALFFNLLCISQPASRAVSLLLLCERLTHNDEGSYSTPALSNQNHKTRSITGSSVCATEMNSARAIQPGFQFNVSNLFYSSLSLSHPAEMNGKRAQDK